MICHHDVMTAVHHLMGRGKTENEKGAGLMCKRLKRFGEKSGVQQCLCDEKQSFTDSRWCLGLSGDPAEVFER